METLTDRITRFLLARIRRLAVLDLYERAAVAGLLEAHFIDGDEHNGTVWRVPQQTLNQLTGDLAKDRKTISRRLGRTVATMLPNEENVAGNAGERRVPLKHHPLTADDHAGIGSVPEPGTTTQAMSAHDILALLRRQLPPSNVANVAGALLVARAVGSSIADLSELLTILRQPAPFVLIKATVPHFERRVGLMLEDGLIMPYWAKLEDVHRNPPLSEEYAERRHGKVRRSVRTMAGSSIARLQDKVLAKHLNDVLLQQRHPVVAVDETPLAPSPYVSMTADIVFECTGLDHELLAELLLICCGIAPKLSLRRMEALALNLEALSIDDLALAIRPGRRLDTILSILTTLGDRVRSKDKAEDDDDDTNRRPAGERAAGPKFRKEFLQKNARSATPAVDGVEVIQPVRQDDGTRKDDGGGEAANGSAAEDSRMRRFRVEEMSGYGQAKEWALDLNDDLRLWRDGSLTWDQMSSKLLLSGSPGTGKTTFARALCNTLQIPLMVTSVAAWLEPGYLGDVLKRMSKAFELARQHAPVILFIDEIDNIGSRSGGHRGQHDDYWRSLINRLLELLDGVSKTEGVVIVAATNLPEKIDPALLRSGRLEKHVEIPLPDIDALVGIIAHHLGEDLETVLASTPMAKGKGRRLLQPIIVSDDRSNSGVPNNG